MEGTIIFDWDGTLHDTAHLYGCAFRKAYAWLEDGGYVPRRTYTDEETSIFLGMSAPDMWKVFMQQLSENDQHTLGGIARSLREKGMVIPCLPDSVKNQASTMIGEEMTAAILAGEACLYQGVPEMLTKLREWGYQLVFLSNCKHAYMEAHRERFHLDQWFSGFYCCEDYGFVPKEQIFPDIRYHFPGKFIMVGDRAADLRVAQIHHLASIGCAYGFGTRQELAVADRIAYKVQEIPELIREL